MKSNLPSFDINQIRKYADALKDSPTAIDWGKTLELDKALPPTSIQVLDDTDGTTEVAYAVWTWDINDNEMKFGKVEVKDKMLQKSGVGTVIMNMVIYIAKFYEAPGITGTIAGNDKHLWHWYAKLGFTIHTFRKLLIEFDES